MYSNYKKSRIIGIRKMYVFLRSLINSGVYKMKLDDILGKSKKKEKKNTAKKVAIGASVGTVVGLAAGALLAPKSGKETREDLAKGAKKTLDTVKESLKDVKDKVEKLADKIDKNGCCEDAAKEEACCCGEGGCEETKAE